jgi:hypothetical protein
MQLEFTFRSDAAVLVFVAHSVHNDDAVLQPSRAPLLGATVAREPAPTAGAREG